MKTTLTAAVILASLAGIGAAAAQDVVIVPERETVIRRYVETRPAASVVIPGYSVSVGSTVPADVELYAIEEPDVTYRYMRVDGRTVLVEPDTRRVVRILD